ncbi:hypothetical protein [Tabrizicola sp.]|uniref:hypothetical protein n=1 Tax=Tabrizicola sp. TaxID=2005166 RepID=UPI0035B3B530
MRALPARLLTAAPALAGPDVVQSSWTCDAVNGKVPLHAAYVAGSDGTVALVAVNGFLIAMSPETVEEGQKFGGPSPDAPGSESVWWDRGDTAWFMARQNGTEAPIATCTRDPE